MKPILIGQLDIDNTSTKEEVTHTPAKHKAEDGTILDSWHRFSIPKGITKEQAQKLQAQLGYHPLGYGFGSFDATKTITRWRCFHSCD